MKNFIIVIFAAVLFAIPEFSNAQIFSPERMEAEQIAQDEKSVILSRVSNLSDEQKQSIEAIYSDYEKSIKTFRLEKRDMDNGDVVKVRRDKLVSDKDQKISAILKKSQLKEYKLAQDYMKNNVDGVPRKR